MRKMYKSAIEKIKGKNVQVVNEVNVERHQEKQFTDLGWVFNSSGEPLDVPDPAPEENTDPDADPDADKE